MHEVLYIHAPKLDLSLGVEGLDFRGRGNYSFVGGKPQSPVVHRSPWELFNVGLIQIHQDKHTVGGRYSASTKQVEYKSETYVSVGSLRCWLDTNLTTVRPCF